MGRSLSWDEKVSKFLQFRVIDILVLDSQQVLQPGVDYVILGSVFVQKMVRLFLSIFEVFQLLHHEWVLLEKKKQFSILNLSEFAWDLLNYLFIQSIFFYPNVLWNVPF